MPAHRVDLVVADAEALLQLLEHRRATSTPRPRAATTSPKRRRRSSSSHRLEQVVGFVRDLEVGVARDAEGRALEDLHPREERAAGSARSRSRAGAGRRASPTREEARQALRHLDAREALLVGLRVARRRRRG